MRLLAILTALLLASPLAACGGGGGSLRDAISTSLTQTIPVRDDALLGSVSRDGVTELDYVMHVGDDSRNVMWRGTTAFDLPEPRPGHVLQAATLKLLPDRFEGDVFGRLGGIYLQKVNLGSTLSAGDYGRAGSGWILAADSETVDTIDVDILDLVQGVYDAGNTRLGLRLRTALSTPSADGRADAAHLSNPLILLSWRRL